MNAFGRFWLLYARNVRQFPRIPTVLVFGIMMPIIQLLLFGSIFSATTETPGHPYQGQNYYSFILPAIILLTAFLGMANSSAAFIVDLRTGYFDKLRTTPANPAAILFARILAETTRVTVQATMILLIAIIPTNGVILDAAIKTGFAGAVVMILASVVFSTMVSGLFALALAMKTRSDQATQSAFPLFFILLFLSTAYMPEALLPGWLQNVVKLNPIDYLIQGLRSLVFDGWSEALPNIGIGLAFGAAIGLVLTFVNVRIYKATVS